MSAAMSRSGGAAADRFVHPLLRAATPWTWVEQACAAPDILLIDHANCEKKAASTALSLMFAYAEDLELTDKMSRLAREELRHYEQVAKLIKSLGIVPQRLAPGQYAADLRRLVAKKEPQREVDLMICGAFIEARSCERFAALGPAIGGVVGELFQGLHNAEARHHRLYLELARRAANRAGIALGERLEEFAVREAELIVGHDEVFRFHSGVLLSADASSRSRSEPIGRGGLPTP
jgi:tRNA 2-(methylsulfanyl)-N6-isopentenyladenosine37 hydroxylase